MITSTTQPYQAGKLRHLGVASLLAVVTLLSRAPYLHQAVINWDESTFILMGQSIVDGHLPYTQTWDLKPPLAFVPFAISITLFGNSIAAIRLLGCLLVAMAAFFLYLLAHRIEGQRVALISAVLLILSVGVLPSGQAIMSEVIALVPLMGALVIVASPKAGAKVFWWSGVLMGIACMVRLNLAYTALIVGTAAVLGPPLSQWRDRLSCGAAYTSGGLSVVLLTFLPYLIAGQATIWWKTMVAAPLALAGSGLSFFGALAHHVYNGFGGDEVLELGNPHPWLGIMLWLGGALGLGWTFHEHLRREGGRKREALVFLAALAGTGLSICLGGTAHSHYLIQVAPFFALGAAVAFNRMCIGRHRRLMLATAVALAVLSFKSSAISGYEMVRDVMHSRPLARGAAYEISNYLSQHNRCRRPVFLLINHIAYWFAGYAPPSSLATHPSNLTKAFLVRVLYGPEITPEMVMNRVLETRPEFVVTQDNLWYLKGKSADITLVANLAQHYTLIKMIGANKIYTLREGKTCPSDPALIHPEIEPLFAVAQGHEGRLIEPRG